jgi:hypothetical protein
MTPDKKPEALTVAARTAKPLKQDGPVLMNQAATAVLVWHGMGQQVPFETIERLGRSLVAHQRASGHSPPPATTRLVEFGDERICRAELEIADASGVIHPVHIYEAYWAPSTQGKITVAETVRFLFNAAYQAVRFALVIPPQFRRFLFNRWITFALQPWLAAGFIVLLLALVSVVLIDTVLGVVGFSKLFTGVNDPDSWPTYALVQDLTVDLGLLSITLAISGVAALATYRHYLSSQRTGLPSRPHRLWQVLLWALAGFGLIVILTVGGLVVWHLVWHFFHSERWWPWPDRWSTITVIIGGLIWTSILAASAGIRWFLLEFVGDSAIYIWSHVVNRFYETRQTIRDDSFATAGAIYAHGGYSRHVLVGHSLGSVIAFDTLNRLLTDDALNGGTLAVGRRTRLLLTFGSILDKTAFLFRTQTGREDIREALAGAAQPLISDPDRPAWVNVFSRHDLFGGRLDYFDPQNGTSECPPDGAECRDPLPIRNIADPFAWIPLLAHDQYWTNPTLIDELVAAIVTDVEASRELDVT